MTVADDVNGAELTARSQFVSNRLQAGFIALNQPDNRVCWRTGQHGIEIGQRGIDDHQHSGRLRSIRLCSGPFDHLTQSVMIAPATFFDIGIVVCHSHRRSTVKKQS